MSYVKNYRILKLAICSNSQDNQHLDGYHYLYIKEHQSKESSARDTANTKTSGSKGRTLFVGNIDYRWNMKEEDLNGYLRLMFSRFGDIRDIYISALPVSDNRTNQINTRHAHIGFDKKSSLKLALTALEADYDVVCKEVTATYGLELKAKQPSDIRKMYAFIDQDADKLQIQVDSYMKNFEEQEIVQLKQREEQLSRPDDDGFIPVTHRKKRKLVDGQDSSSKSSRSGNRKKKVTELKNFYHYQLKQQRVQDLDNLRKRFAEDKEKVSKLKEQRKFKPF